MLNLKSFYPTPPALISKMLAKVQGSPKKVLDPEAGKGDIIDYLKDTYSYNWRKYAEVSAIEINETLQATLRGKGIKVIDTDFLAFSGQDKFDLIIMNPPFDEGDKHLLKAIEILYRGEIVCLLNAETIRNPHTNTRALLARKLNELGASIEYIKNAFVVAERSTAVEVAMVYIKIEREVEADLFADCEDHATRAHEPIADKHEVSTGKTITELVLEYNEIIQVGTETITGYYRNYNKVGKYISMFDANEKNHYQKDGQTLTALMQTAVNNLLASVRVDFWRQPLDLKEVRSRLTRKKQDEFEEGLKHRCHMDFTESNIRQFVLNLIGTYEQTLTEAVLDIFDMFTIRHTWDGENQHEKNIHYFNGWKTNKAFKVGKRAVIPIHGSYSGPFRGYKGWDLNYNAEATLRDIDLVFTYFDGNKSHETLPDAIKRVFATGDNSGESTYFKFTCHKKGTIHLTFKDEDILRRFNVVACRGKNWLPGDFGSRPYKELSAPERSVIDSFEDAKTYDKYVNQTMFRIADQGNLQIGFSGALGA